MLSVADEIVAYVRGSRFAAVLRGPRFGQLDARAATSGSGVRVSLAMRSIDVAISVARRGRHRRVHAGGIAAKHGFRRTRRLDERVPVDAADGAQAHDAVRHHELRQRLLLRRLLRRFLDRHVFVGDPLLEPEQRREIRSPAADLLQESRDERRAQIWRLMHERHQCRAELGVRWCAENAGHPVVRANAVVEIPHGDQRHAADVLEEPHAQHRRDRPQLAHRQRRDRLVFADDPLDARQRQPAVGVRDELEHDVVDARVAGERPLDELRQLVIVAAGQGGVDLAHLFQDDKEIVEEPGPGRTHFER